MRLECVYLILMLTFVITNAQLYEHEESKASKHFGLNFLSILKGGVESSHNHEKTNLETKPLNPVQQQFANGMGPAYPSPYSAYPPPYYPNYPSYNYPNYQLPVPGMNQPYQQLPMPMAGYNYPIQPTPGQPGSNYPSYPAPFNVPQPAPGPYQQADHHSRRK